MRLVDLDPRWYGDRGGHGQGVMFDCPVHGDAHKIGVPFENPIDGGPKMREGQGKRRDKWWHRVGDTFDTLTITPSVHVLDTDSVGREATHWHGFVTAGEVCGC